MKKLVLASLILASNQMATAANWVLSSATSTVYQEKVRIDFDSVRGYYFNGYDKINYYVTAWVEKDYPNFQALDGGRKYKRTVEFWNVDCLNNKIITSEMLWYKSSGDVIHNERIYISTYSSDGWYRIVSGSVGEMIAKDICSIYQVKQSYQK